MGWMGHLRGLCVPSALGVSSGRLKGVVEASSAGATGSDKRHAWVRGESCNRSLVALAEPIVGESQPMLEEGRWIAGATKSRL